jgi:hypothetical protein
MTTIRQAFTQGMIGEEWRIELWWGVHSYIPTSSRACAYPRYTDHREEYFEKESNARKYSSSMSKEHPERCVSVERRYILVTHNGKYCYTLGRMATRRKSGQFKPIRKYDGSLDHLREK